MATKKSQRGDKPEGDPPTRRASYKKKTKHLRAAITNLAPARTLTTRTTSKPTVNS